MKLSKTSVQSVDLDDLERQLREVAVSSLPKKNEDPLGELARIVGREKPLRSIVGGRAEAGQSVPQPAVANDTAPAQMRARPAESESEAETADWEGEVEDAAEEQFAYEGRTTSRAHLPPGIETTRNKPVHTLASWATSDSAQSCRCLG